MLGFLTQGELKMVISAALHCFFDAVKITFDRNAHDKSFLQNF